MRSNCPRLEVPNQTSIMEKLDGIPSQGSAAPLYGVGRPDLSLWGGEYLLKGGVGVLRGLM